MYFSLLEPPFFTERLEPMDVTMGDAVCLKCQIDGTPEIKVSWFKADGKVRSSPTCKMEFSKGTACLKLAKVTKADVGEYTCKAENSIGSASSSCLITVQGEATSISLQASVFVLYMFPIALYNCEPMYFAICFLFRCKNTTIFP